MVITLQVMLYTEYGVDSNGIFDQISELWESVN